MTLERCQTATSTSQHGVRTQTFSSAYRIHGADHGEIGARIVTSGDQEAVSLSSGDVNHLSLGSIYKHTIHLDDFHSVTFDPKVLAGECADVGHVEVVGLSRLDRDGDILCIVNQCSLRHGLCSSRVLNTDEFGHEAWHLIVVPVGKCDDNFFIVLSLERVHGVVDDKYLTQTVWVLAPSVRMVPICSGLRNLGVKINMPLPPPSGVGYSLL